MSGKESGESFEILAPDQMSDFPLRQDMGKDVIPSNSTSSVSPVSSDESGNKVVDQPSAMEQSDHHPPTTHYDAGGTGAFHRSEGKDHINRASGSSSLGSSFMGSRSASQFSSTSNQNSGAYYVQSRAYGRAWNDNSRYRSQGNGARNGEFRASNEVVTRGPRFVHGRNIPAKTMIEAEQLARPTINRNKYNSQDFQTEYDDAKFYIIKSFNEDDVHKGIKYNVWSSTPYGNRKLAAVFGEIEAKTTETGKPCPIFLFFSVNTSGQFVGVAEMVAPVDFAKDLDFWQDEKWTCFFPIIWHIIKDVPSALFWHIILENNEGKPVTNSRDTQEIGLEQGLEMLRIFKNYSERTSILDDFSFYEQREKSLGAKRRPAKSASRANSEH